LRVWLRKLYKYYVNYTDNQSFDLGEFGAAEHHKAPQYESVTTRSLYVTMRDGIKIAIDVVLPQGLPVGARLPAVMILTRYWRSVALRLPAQPGKAAQANRGPIVDFFGSHGYAVVIVDARGSGASFGQWSSPWSPDEIEDYGEVASWIVHQSWSDGNVGAMGFSYEGTAAQLSVTADQSAVKAVVPEMIEFDVYTDILFPGGIFNEWFAAAWNDNNVALDKNKLPGLVPWYLRLLVEGVRPVDTDKDRQHLKEAVSQHENNLDVHNAVKDVVYRDDRVGSLNVTLDECSVFSYKDKIEQSHAAIFGWGSWLDAATADTVIRRFLTFNNPQRAVIGAWDHVAEHHGSPYLPPKSPPVPNQETQLQESLRFFDKYLRSNDDDSVPERVLFYFTMGEETWKTTSVWPPTGMITQRWYFSPGNSLSLEPPTAATGADTYTADFEATTGTLNRWHTEMKKPVVYPDRAEMDRRLLTYTSPPMSKDMEITGYPVITLYVTSTAEDGAFFVYLEEVDKTGKVIYITEGQLRALHRQVSTEPPPYKMQVPYHSFKSKDGLPLVPGEVTELTFGLLPTSALIRKGHCLRIAIAGHDKDTFTRIPSKETPVITFARNKKFASFITLPVVG